jgi:hypothetical protein
MAKGFKTGGRQKGTPNKITALLKDEILMAADNAHPEGRVGYLTQQAVDNPSAFLTLLGKVLPVQHAGGEDDGSIGITFKTVIEHRGDS